MADRGRVPALRLRATFDEAVEALTRPVKVRYIPGRSGALSEGASALSYIIPQNLMKDLSSEVNVVVIVPSFSVAEHWRGIASQILSGNDITAGVERLREHTVGLTVLVNRYDGIDLPGDACRVLAIVDLPEVTSYSDVIDGEILSHTTVTLRRHIERIEQGMGRGIRSKRRLLRCCVIWLKTNRSTSVSRGARNADTRNKGTT